MVSKSAHSRNLNEVHQVALYTYICMYIVYMPEWHDTCFSVVQAQRYASMR